MQIEGAEAAVPEKETESLPCAPHVVSPRDLWLCVLPRWQFNVNVNVKKQRGECVNVLSRIRLYAGSLRCARTDGANVSSGGG